MKSSAKKVELASVDDLFSTEESRADAQRERVLEIPLSELHPFKNHPFKVKDDESMMETADSVRQYGVLVPAIARPDPEGGYELVAGHRRHRASELAEKETMPVIVRELDDDAATIIMVDTASEALAVSIAEKACVDMAYMSELTDKTSDELAAELQGVIFRVPGQLEKDATPHYVTADEYLSGNVRRKLRQAQRAAQQDPSFAVNVEALTAAQPKDLDGQGPFGARIAGTQRNR